MVPPFLEVQPIGIHGEHNSYGDTADRSMKWTVDDPDLLQMTAAEGYAGGRYLRAVKLGQYLRVCESGKNMFR